jgi:hypothetical protein
MTSQLELFVSPERPTPDERDKRKLLRTLRATPKGGLVNGMTKAQLRRYAPAKLPKVTL